MEPFDLPSGPDRDAMLFGRASGTGFTPVGSTLNTIQQIGDPTLRRDAFDQAMEQYMIEYKRLPDYGVQARAWLEKADVPEEWKRRWR
jgi:hypothetical protein